MLSLSWGPGKRSPQQSLLQEFNHPTTQQVDNLKDVERYIRHLAVVCPAVLIGLTVYIPNVDNPVVITIIYPFNFASMRAMALGAMKIVDLIFDTENLLRDKGKDK